MLNFLNFLIQLDFYHFDCLLQIVASLPHLEVWQDVKADLPGFLLVYRMDQFGTIDQRLDHLQLRVDYVVGQGRQLLHVAVLTNAVIYEKTTEIDDVIHFVEVFREPEELADTTKILEVVDMMWCSCDTPNKLCLDFIEYVGFGFLNGLDDFVHLIDDDSLEHLFLQQSDTALCD